MLKKNKIFCIGANKTGTTTLKKQLIKYGLSTPLQIKQELLNKKLVKGDFNDFLTLINNFDFFQDSPFSHGVLFAQLDLLFPNSKFILTIREENEWFDSLTKFHANLFKKKSFKEIKINDLKNAKYVYKGYFYDSFIKNWLYNIEDNNHVIREDLLYDKNFFIQKYRNRNSLILNYFFKRDNLFVLNLKNNKSDKKLIEFLNLNIKPSVFGHYNKTK